MARKDYGLLLLLVGFYDEQDDAFALKVCPAFNKVFLLLELSTLLDFAHVQ